LGKEGSQFVVSLGNVVNVDIDVTIKTTYAIIAWLEYSMGLIN